MKAIEFLIMFLISSIVVIVVLEKDATSVSLLTESLKILISGYLGYLIKDTEENIKPNRRNYEKRNNEALQERYKSDQEV
jgi:hypothetical protein